MGSRRCSSVIFPLEEPAAGSTLRPMQAPAAAPPSPIPRSFAGLLADYAAPEKKFPHARDLDGLADDIATLSYEHALRAHARYHAEEPAAAPPAMRQPAPLPQVPPEPTPAREKEGRKCASITLRLTVEEDHLLRRRAAEAGMSISAYLRSCAFEVESLRAEVKQTISELRRTEPQPAPAPLWSRIAPWLHWRKSKAS
jgi:hypothetical protein